MGLGYLQPHFSESPVEAAHFCDWCPPLWVLSAARFLDAAFLDPCAQQRFAGAEISEVFLH